MKPYTISHRDGIYFCTDTIISFAYVFVEIEFFEIIIDSLKYCQKEKELQLIAYVIMPNHVHTILGTNNGNISNILRDYKQYTSRKITETLRQRGKVKTLSLFKSAAKRDGKDNQYKVWQSGSHPLLMDYDEKLFQKIEYVHHNPVRKGFVEDPENWAYSSARNYIANDASIIEIQKLW